ncbi:hypothetical protein A3B21_02160 [Candidatus Uhrbacteria bacterium RIFCSPLOWO2_01_FULL_47_24]|uniref:Uncharacterized protein n=1 Tax=Candidatus Uhrbacteria bacterium RIFCSPLOWO2_01_FULL_47_24 TaxID=1802401 RepID=A0A1F7UPF6_9BACT|nr:MAG: hypothetical protein A2753_03655 [Candidatus Uhrbacteria bacterium RIFCSPHIGHO2_01_FULL_47_11]OGL68065.1 MAG: hypothetical protein A3D58_00645 [Candidatus Uhrbacteria bacterium RIFCSPHIGHO2_02_FULL_46_47]OGL75439.1 MAG: hypothetical protein A3F52_05355 [Candidatus Uhrbacteria bacterium RIFCSPHIGHO2_12_FULL_47_11]OGL80156.1 MAG: hypothetical protein A3B21_02160 [Candidatus Uhrbacteria bacterium RIFCSPLOWO2_01_FULL_47_24]OGL84942.1 MAG: hypothetical protein A3J03_04545 [Candidatus Uhrbact
MEDEIKELVIARLQTLPDDISVSVGADGEYSRDQIIQHVEEGDEVGKKMVEIEMNFLRSLKEGKLYETYGE